MENLWTLYGKYGIIGIRKGTFSVGLYIYPDAAFVASTGGASALVSPAAIAFVCSCPFHCAGVEFLGCLEGEHFGVCECERTQNVGEARKRTQGVLRCVLVQQLGKK